MKRGVLIGILTVFLLCTACGTQAEPMELTRVVFARGHGSTWGNQFHMDVCSTEISYAHFFAKGEEGQTFRELYAVPVDETVWEQIKTAAMRLLPQLEVQKPPTLLEQLAQKVSPIEVDGGAWTKLTVTWLVDGEPQDEEYIWSVSPEAEALELLLEELAQSLDE